MLPREKVERLIQRLHTLKEVEFWLQVMTEEEVTESGGAETVLMKLTDHLHRQTMLAAFAIDSANLPSIEAVDVRSEKESEAIDPERSEDRGSPGSGVDNDPQAPVAAAPA